MYNITFKWILGVQNKAAECLSSQSLLNKVPDTPAATSILVHLVVTSAPDRPATHTHSKTKNMKEYYATC